MCKKEYATFVVAPGHLVGSSELMRDMFWVRGVLLQMASELVHMQAALDRVTLDQYHTLDPEGHGQELKALQDHRAAQKQDFSNQFLSLLHQHEITKHTHFLEVLY